MNAQRSVILRFPEEDVDKINKLKENENIVMRIDIGPSSRFGSVYFYDRSKSDFCNDFIYDAEVLELPRHVESFEFNSEEQGISFYNKKDDVSQIIIAKHRNSAPIFNGPDTVVHGVKGPYPIESYTYRHGITPPTANIVPKSIDYNEIEQKRAEIYDMERVMQFSVTGEEVQDN